VKWLTCGGIGFEEKDACNRDEGAKLPEDAYLGQNATREHDEKPEGHDQ